MMKTIIFLGITSLIIFSSCKKSYQCDCSQSKSVTYKERKRENATAACKAKAKTTTGEDCRIIN